MFQETLQILDISRNEPKVLLSPKYFVTIESYGFEVKKAYQMIHFSQEGCNHISQFKSNKNILNKKNKMFLVSS